jgi:hypothetical protein
MLKRLIFPSDRIFAEHKHRLYLIQAREPGTVKVDDLSFER